MARHISVETAIEKNRIASDVAFVLLIEVDIVDETGDVVDHLRLARNSEDVVYGGETYTAANFEAKYKADVEEEPSLTFEANDMSGYIRSRMEAYGGGLGSECVVTVVNTGNLDQPPEIVETYQVTAASSQGYKVMFTLGVDNPLMIQWPKIKQTRDQCQWVFKGPRCKYAGAATKCSFTYAGANGCLAKNNTANFGGFRGLKPLYLR